MKTTSLFVLAGGLLASVLLSGCGPSEPSASTSAAPAGARQAAAPAPKEGRPITIVGNDSMKFDVTEIRAKAGEALAVTLKNTGTMPKFSMGHNWVLLDQGVDVNAFAGEAAQAAKSDYVPTVNPGRVLAATKLLGPKESDTVIFQVPTKPGRYVYLCSFPGHFQVGMKGELVVE